jgi:putative transposase
VYFYRNLPPELKAEVLRQRRLAGYPLHAPPHPREAAGWFLMTAATYEHQAHFTTSADRSGLLAALLGEVSAVGSRCGGWVVLPNHYHLLLHCERLGDLSRALGRAHRRTSRRINERDGVVGRRVWYRFGDRRIRSERHTWLKRGTTGGGRLR